MKPILAEDMRAILDRLDEYLIDLGEDQHTDLELDDQSTDEKKGDIDDGAKDTRDDKDIEEDKSKPKEKTDTPTKDEDEDQIPDVNSILKKDKKLDRIVSSINVQALSDFLELPPKYRPHFRQAIYSLRSVSRTPTVAQNEALAVAFVKTLRMFQGAFAHATAHGHVAEELDDNKIKTYLAKNQTQPNSSNLGQMKDMIAAVDKHGTPQEKKELGLDEQTGPKMPVRIIAYNSGYGEKLDDIAKDPKRQKEVLGMITMDHDGRPVLKFSEKGDTHVYMADWHPNYGWVADYD